MNIIENADIPVMQSNSSLANFYSNATQKTNSLAVQLEVPWRLFPKILSGCRDFLSQTPVNIGVAYAKHYITRVI